jgi:hypothetical protein
MFDINQLLEGEQYQYKGNTVVYQKELPSNSVRKFLFIDETGKPIRISQALAQRYLWAEMRVLDLSKLEAFCE